MASRTEALQAAARAFAGTAGQFNEDVLAALRSQYGGNGGFSEMCANVPGGLEALLRNPVFAASFYLNLSNATNATIADSQGVGMIP